MADWQTENNSTVVNQSINQKCRVIFNKRIRDHFVSFRENIDNDSVKVFIVTVQKDNFSLLGEYYKPTVKKFTSIPIGNAVDIV